MGVAAEHVQHARPREAAHPLAEGLVGQERRGPLDEGTTGGEPPQPLHEVLAGVAFRMRHDRAETPRPELLNRVLEPVVERAGRRLEQDPPPCPSKSHRRELVVVEPTEIVAATSPPGRIRVTQPASRSDR